jgi:hypothetical protein
MLKRKLFDKMTTDEKLTWHCYYDVMYPSSMTVLHFIIILFSFVCIFVLTYAVLLTQGKSAIDILPLWTSAMQLVRYGFFVAILGTLCNVTEYIIKKYKEEKWINSLKLNER